MFIIFNFLFVSAYMYLIKVYTGVRIGRKILRNCLKLLFIGMYVPDPSLSGVCTFIVDFH